MNLTHKIALDPTAKQAAYFRRAAGTARFVYNWALAEWNRQYQEGGRPIGSSLRKQFNKIYPVDIAWVADVHRDCHSQPFADLQMAFNSFFAGRSDAPSFKRKGKTRPSFYVANDQFSLNGKIVRLPRIGKIRMREAIRLSGKINSARVVEECGRWFVCVSVNVGDLHKERTGGGTVGVDLGIKTLATLSTREQIENPKPLRKAQERLRRASRKLCRRQKGSSNREKQIKAVAKIHLRIRNIRHDGLHKLTTRLCKNHATVVIEDLNVSGMVKNHKLAQAISDVGFRILRQMLSYKAVIFGVMLIVADRFFPSSKMCSSCGLVKEKLSLGERVFECPCGLRIDRDLNASLNLKQLGQAMPEVTAVEMPPGVVEAATK